MLRKILATILIVAVLSLGCVISVAASNNSKISTQLDEVINSASNDELIQTIIVVNIDTVYHNEMEYILANGYDTDKYFSDSEYNKQCFEEWSAYLEEYRSQNEVEMMAIYEDLFGEDTENLLYCYTTLKTMIINATKSEIMDAANSDRISSIDYFDNSISEGNASVIDFTELCKEAYFNFMGIATDDEQREFINFDFYGTVDEFCVFRAEGECAALLTDQKIGNYLFTNFCIAGPEVSNPIGMYVADSNGNIIFLKEAYDEGLIDIDKVAKIVPYTYMYGDANDDGVLTVKDATYIQKIVADILEPVENRKTGTGNSPDDMNMDGKVNVKDATAIQKYIAGLPY